MTNTQNMTADEMPALQGEVLLAEDSVMNQQLISAYLRKMGARVTIADNGEMAVSLAQQKDFDLIYMDMQMPIMSGEDAVKKLRELNFKTPIVILTANEKQEDRDLCEKAGSDDYLVKPIVQSVLYKMTARYLPNAG